MVFFSSSTTDIGMPCVAVWYCVRPPTIVWTTRHFSFRDGYSRCQRLRSFLTFWTMSSHLVASSSWLPTQPPSIRVASWSWAMWMSSARVELLVFTALVIMRFDIAPVEGDGWPKIPVDNASQIAAVDQPDHDLKVELRPRGDIIQIDWTLYVSMPKKSDCK